MLCHRSVLGHGVLSLLANVLMRWHLTQMSLMLGRELLGHDETID